MTIRIRTLKGQPIGDASAADTIISIVEPCPHFDDLPAQATLFTSEARRIENALRNSLPGGVYDRLLGAMLEHKASHFIVSWSHLGGEEDNV